MLRSLIDRWGPFYDVADAAGAGATVVETPPVATNDVETSTDDDSSLADHEAQFAPGSTRRESAAAAEPAAEPAVEAPEAKAARERDEKTGQFVKPKHRAKSQEATPADVPRINELTRRLREAEARAEAAERRATERPSERREEPRREEQKPTAAAKPTLFPPFEVWSEHTGSTDWYEYDHASKEWFYQQRRAEERAKDAADAEAATIRTHLDAYKTKMAGFVESHPDFDEVIDAAPKVSAVIARAVLEIGPEAAYFLATHAEERDALDAETASVDPKNPAFAATVAATRRYLQTLVASEQRPSSSRPAAVATGAALALVSPTAPKPPTPVRTGALRRDDAPNDDESLDDHERRYGPKSKRA